MPKHTVSYLLFHQTNYIRIDFALIYKRQSTNDPMLLSSLR
jgi:hypothetical protein